MNRADIRNLVIAHTGRTDKASLINSMITAALKKVSSEMLWGDLLTEASVTLIPNQAFIDLDAATVRLAEVRIIDDLSSWKVDIRTKNWILSRWPDLGSQAFTRPNYAYLEGKRLHMMPGPDTNWTMEYSYYKRAADLTDDSTELVPAHADEAIIAFATYRTFKSLQMHEDANLWFADYRGAIADAKKMDRASAVNTIAEQYGQPRGVRSNYHLDPFIKKVP